MVWSIWTEVLVGKQGWINAPCVCATPIAAMASLNAWRKSLSPSADRTSVRITRVKLRAAACPQLNHSSGLGAKPSCSLARLFDAPVKLVW